jgi:shikimate kinase
MMPLAARRDRIYLTGFMGSGKSTIGPILANTIAYEFVDLDRTIEVSEGKTVREIFSEKGEAYFRQLERDLVTGLAARTRIVVSLGGGTLVDPTCLQTVLTTGILVYLKLTPDQLFHRLHRRSDRPLLTDEEGNRLTEDGLRHRIRELFGAREPIYSRADITIEADEQRVGKTVDRIVRSLSPHIE